MASPCATVRRTVRFMEWETWRDALRGLADMPDEIDLCPHWLGSPRSIRFDRFVEYAFATSGQPAVPDLQAPYQRGRPERGRARLLDSRTCRTRPRTPSTSLRHRAFSREAYKDEGPTNGSRHRIERFLRVRAEARVERPYVTLAYVVQPGNDHEALAFRDHWRSILDELGRSVRQTWDWPDRHQDTLYFRPLNTGDQAAADRLHAQVCRDLGLTDTTSDRLRSAESF